MDFRRAASAHDAFQVNGALCVNILAGRHQDLSDRFGRSGIPVEQRFAGAAWAIAMEAQSRRQTADRKATGAVRQEMQR